MNSEYHYHIEDGQFTKELYLPNLIGNEGDVKIVDNDDFGEVEFYILYVEGNYVECIGNVDRTFPNGFSEHEKIKLQMKAAYANSDSHQYYNVTFTQEFSSEIQGEKIVSAKSEEEARQLFMTDYPNLNILQIELP